MAYVPVRVLILFFAALLFQVGFGFAQKQNQTWALSGAFLKFDAAGNANFIGEPQFPLNSLEGLASVCDPLTGRFLFATDGVVVYDSTFNIMPNGSGLLGGVNRSSSQGALIVPRPQWPGHYYIFVIDEIESSPRNMLSYSEIDMSLNNGKGDVVASVKNIALLFGWYTSEKMAVTPMGNGTGYWVLTHQLNNERFTAFMVTADGVNPQPINSDIGSAHIEQGQFSTSRGCMKFSPDGTKIALAFSIGIIFELFEFDKCTGRVFNNMFLISPGPDNPFYNTYGVEFSPDSKKVFFTNFGIETELQQMDISVFNEEAILRSRKSIYYNLDFRKTFGSLQLAPNGKIYMAVNNANAFGVINNPNDTGINCNFELAGLPTPGYTIKLGLPQIVPDALNGNPIRRNYAISGRDTCYLSSSFFALNGDTSGLKRIWWAFDDLSSGASNFAMGAKVSHVFSGKGSYNIKIVIATECEQIELPEYRWTVSHCSTETTCFAEFPSVITANNDNRNDWFNPFFSCEPSDYQIQVYNRWGAKVFESTLLNGKYPELNPGTYFYRCKYRFSNSAIIIKLSWFEVLGNN